jgi:hypothetical protein
MNRIIVAKQLAKQKANNPTENKLPTSVVKPEIIESKPTNNQMLVPSGPYSYTLFFEDKGYPHSVNITKLYFRYSIQNLKQEKIIYLSTGHSFAESKYKTNFNTELISTPKIHDIFTISDKNIFYSLDNGFDDFCLIHFDNKNLLRDNFLQIKNELYPVKSVCRNMNIKFLENELLLKNGHNTGESYSKAIINFETDAYLTTKNNKNTYYSFKINGQVVLISSKFPSGIVVKGISSSLSQYNNEPVTQSKINEIFEYYFLSILKEFKHHELFQNIEIEPDIKKYWTNYKLNNCLSIVTLMGDSGAGFFRMLDKNDLEFVGINIGSCPMIILSESNIKNNSNKLLWDESIGKLRLGKYIIDEIHRGSQLLPINQIEELINRNLPMSIRVNEITV